MKNIISDINRYNYGDSFVYAIVVACSKLGFWAVINYRVGRYLRTRFINIPIIKQFIWVGTGFSKLLVEILTGVSIPYSVTIGEGFLIAHFSNVIISDAAVIGKMATLHQGVTIGISGRVKRGVPVIGDNFFAGANAVIVGPIIIEDNVVVAANSLVYKNVKVNSVVSSHKIQVINTMGSCNA